MLAMNRHTFAAARKKSHVVLVTTLEPTGDPRQDEIIISLPFTNYSVTNYKAANSPGSRKELPDEG